MRGTQSIRSKISWTANDNAPMAKQEDHVRSYAEKIVKKKIIAGELVRLACKRHLQDLKSAKKRGLHFDPKAASRAVQFFSFLHHSKTREWAGKPFVLELWEKFIVGSIFGWKKADGNRRYKVGYVEVAKKNGKSTLAAGVGLKLFVDDSEPGAEIYTAATTRDQARIVHSEAIRMVRATAALARRIRVYKDNLNILKTNSKYEPLGKDKDSTDGINPHGVIIDELHRHKSRDMWELMDNSGAARSQPLLLGITTAGTDKRTVCGEQRDYAERILRGIIEDDTYFAYIATLDEGDDWTDPKNFAKANPNLGVSIKIDELKEKCEKAKQIPAYQNAFRRYRLNEWLQQANRYLPMDAWNKCAAGLDLEELKGKEAIGGLDLANTIDIAAFCLLFPPDDLPIEVNAIEEEEGNAKKTAQIDVDKIEGCFRVLPFFFVPEQNIAERGRNDNVPYETWVQQGLIETTPGNVIDYEFIKSRIISLSEVYKITQIGYDPWNATQFATQMQEIHGFEMVEVRQGYKTLSEPTKLLLRLLLGQKIAHGGHSVLKWMADNLVVRMDPAENVKPDKEKSKQKIDGIVALIITLALSTRTVTMRSIYESRGILTLPGI